MIRIFRLAWIIWKNNIRLVHLNLHFEASLVVAACAITCVPLIVHVRNMVTEPVDSSLRKSDGIIVISKAVSDALFSVGKLTPADVAGRLWLVPDGRELSPYRDGDRLQVRRELGWDQGEKIVGMVARITPMKGQEIFLQMAAFVAKALPEARFLLVGGPFDDHGAEYLRNLQQLVSNLGLSDRVVFTGYREDVPRLLSALDCFVHPSRRGAFVSVLIEAMASRIPIVASDVDGIPECVGRDGAAALVYPITPEGFAEATLKILQDKQIAANMGRIGRLRAQRYEITGLARETENIFDTVRNRFRTFL
ncbi:MAG TPA: glycosyltransferase [Terriglobales bacterium]|nr:glycosyltransferase [Terriglobales bacterium]